MRTPKEGTLIFGNSHIGFRVWGFTQGSGPGPLYPKPGSVALGVQGLCVATPRGFWEDYGVQFLGSFQPSLRSFWFEFALAAVVITGVSKS